MIVAGIEYEDEDAELFPDGTVHDATLTRDTVIQGVPCTGGRSVVFFPSGRLKFAWLSTGITLHGIPCAAGLAIFLHENGRVLNADLAEKCQLHGKEFLPGARVTLDESGNLLECEECLEEDAVIDGVPCAAARPIWRYANGQLSLVVLSAPHAVSGVVYPRGTQLFLEEDGSVFKTLNADLDSGRRYMQRIFGVYEGPVD